MILDWRGEEIVSSIDESIFGHGRQRNAFYKNYVSSLEEIVGSRKQEELFENVDGVHNWLELFNKIHREFNGQSFLRRAFGTYTEFFNAFFVHPYGIYFENEKFIDNLGALEKKKEKKIAEFTRRINLPVLLWQSIQSHKKKLTELQKVKVNEILEKNELQISYSSGLFRSNIKGTIKPEFSSNYWQNILDNSNDCIFITSNEEGNTGKVQFPEYWLGSLLHMYHPSINYLNFVAAKELRKKFPHPLFKVKLIETSDKNVPLIVGGVLGSNLKKFELLSESYANMADFIDSSIWDVFQQKFSGKSLIYNLRHQTRGDKPAHQFVDSIRNKHRGEEKKSLEEMNYSVPNDDNFLISNVVDGKKCYGGEQYSETFSFPNQSDEKGRLGAFVHLEGKVNGIVGDRYVSCLKVSRRKWPMAPALAVVGLLAGGAGALQTYNQPTMCRKAEIDGLTRIKCEVNAETRTFGMEDMHNLLVTNGTLGDDFSLVKLFYSGTRRPAGLAVATIHGRRYKFELQDSNDLERLQKGWAHVDHYKKILTSPGMCTSVTVDGSFMNSLASCTNDLSVLLRALDMDSKFNEQGLGRVLPSIQNWLLSEASMTRSSTIILDYLAGFSEPKAMKILWDVEQMTTIYNEKFPAMAAFGITVDVTEDLVGTIQVALATKNNHIFEKTVSLLGDQAQYCGKKFEQDPKQIQYCTPHISMVGTGTVSQGYIDFLGGIKDISARIGIASKLNKLMESASGEEIFAPDLDVYWSQVVSAFTRHLSSEDNLLVTGLLSHVAQARSVGLHYHRSTEDEENGEWFLDVLLLAQVLKHECILMKYKELHEVSKSDHYIAKVLEASKYGRLDTLADSGDVQGTVGLHLSDLDPGTLLTRKLFDNGLLSSYLNLPDVWGTRFPYIQGVCGHMDLSLLLVNTDFRKEKVTQSHIPEVNSLRTAGYGTQSATQADLLNHATVAGAEQSYLGALSQLVTTSKRFLRRNNLGNGFNSGSLHLSPRDPRDFVLWAGLRGPRVLYDDRIALDDFVNTYGILCGFLSSNKFNADPEWCEGTGRLGLAIKDCTCRVDGAPNYDNIDYDNIKPVQIFKTSDGQNCPDRAVCSFTYTKCVNYGCTYIECGFGDPSVDELICSMGEYPD